ncbi:hypothetical protein [Streptomyces sp. NRRL S-87]|uniref:hypothetical protein n=1 Tax=Streptomyces sp. NRRL S-87 TaxID=1463920 RepID=UPI0004C15956|nr:hypothetical protein [Streptomyces sp. NRRL S-87]
MNRRSVALTTATVVIGVGFGAAVAVPAAADWYQHRSPAAVSAAYAAPSPGSDAGSASVSGTVAATADGKGAARAAKAAERHSADTGAFGYVVRSTGGDRILRVALPHHAARASCHPSAHSVPWLRAHQGDPGTARAGARTPGHCGPHAAHPGGDASYTQGRGGHR